MEQHFGSTRALSGLSHLLISTVLPSITTTATATLLPSTTAHASASAPASVPTPGGRPCSAAAQGRWQELPHSVSGCDMLLLRDRRGVRVLVSLSTSPHYFHFYGEKAQPEMEILTRL